MLEILVVICVDSMKKKRRSRGRGPWQANEKRGPLPQPAGGLDAAAHRLHQMLDNGQAEAGSAQFAGARLIHAVEALEDARQVTFRDADAVIRDFQAHLA